MLTSVIVQIQPAAASDPVTNLDWVAAFGPIAAALATAAVAIFTLVMQRRNTRDALDAAKEAAEESTRREDQMRDEATKREDRLRADATKREDQLRADERQREADRERARLLHERYEKVANRLFAVEHAALSGNLKTMTVPLHGSLQGLTRAVGTLPRSDPAVATLWLAADLIRDAPLLAHEAVSTTPVLSVQLGAIGEARQVVNAVLRKDEPPRASPFFRAIAGMANKRFQASLGGESTQPSVEWTTTTDVRNYAQHSEEGEDPLEGANAFFAPWQELGRPGLNDPVEGAPEATL